MAKNVQSTNYMVSDGHSFHLIAELSGTYSSYKLSVQIDCDIMRIAKKRKVSKSLYLHIIIKI